MRFLYGVLSVVGVGAVSFSLLLIWNASQIGNDSHARKAYGELQDLYKEALAENERSKNESLMYLEKLKDRVTDDYYEKDLAAAIEKYDKSNRLTDEKFAEIKAKTKHDYQTRRVEELFYGAAALLISILVTVYGVSNFIIEMRYASKE